MANKTEKPKAEIVIDAENAVVGRLASFAAKKSLNGNAVAIINSEKAKIIGTPSIIINKYMARIRLGRGAQKGPIIRRKPSELLRRAIRGMIEYKKGKGSEAFKRIRCYEGVPKLYENKEAITLPTKEAIKFITLKNLSRHLTGK
ncbi:MAG: 50S ribosomal protein L13 [Candidatus Pacearchaeota archaeon]